MNNTLSKRSHREMADYLVRCAMALLDEQLNNHPDREGQSVAYRIEQAILTLLEAQQHELDYHEWHPK